MVIAPYVHGHGRPNGRSTNDWRQIAHRRDVLSIEAQDDVALANSRLCRGAPRRDRRNDGAAMFLGTEPFSDVVVHGLHLDADPTSPTGERSRCPDRRQYGLKGRRGWYGQVLKILGEWGARV